MKKRIEEYIIVLKKYKEKLREKKSQIKFKDITDEKIDKYLEILEENKEKSEIQIKENLKNYNEDEVYILKGILSELILSTKLKNRFKYFETFHKQYLRKEVYDKMTTEMGFIIKYEGNIMPVFFSKIKGYGREALGAYSTINMLMINEYPQIDKIILPTEEIIKKLNEYQNIKNKDYKDERLKPLEEEILSNLGNAKNFGFTQKEFDDYYFETNLKLISRYDMNNKGGYTDFEEVKENVKKENPIYYKREIEQDIRMSQPKNPIFPL